MSRWVSQALTDHHEVEAFDSGKPDLDRWLTEQSLRAHTAGSVHTTVWTQTDDPRVVAFHAIAPSQFVGEELPSRRLAGGYSAVPGYLIARLALHVSLHGQGLGSQLLLDALERISDAAALAGGRLIAVDAIDEHAHRFYRHHDFQPIPASSRLVMKVATARDALGRRSSGD